MKKILVNYCDLNLNFNPKNNIFYNILKKHYTLELSDNPEFLFYSCFGNDFKKFSNCLKICFLGENVRPDFNECDYAIGFDYITFEDRYFRNSRFVQRSAHERSDAELLSRKFCNFIYSNAGSGAGADIRQDFCKKLMQYKHVDCPGKVLNNMRDAIEPRNGNWVAGKLEFIKNYKFTIAFENSSTPGYVTEKLMQPLQANSVPIYWGDPVVAREFNPKAFVNCHDFADFDEVIEFVKYLDTHDDAYLDMLRQPPMQADYDPSEHDLEKFLLHIIEHGTPQVKDPRGIWAHRHEKNLEIALSSVTQKILQPIVSPCGLDANTLLKELPYRPKDDALIQPVMDCVRKVTLPGNILHPYAEMLAPTPAMAAQRIHVHQSAAQRMQTAGDKARLSWSDDPSLEAAYRTIFALLAPCDIADQKKVRIGGRNDGGYVMPDPGRDGIAYSFGVSHYSPWDTQMAERGFKVYQFDGTIEDAPEKHPNCFFYKKNISGKAQPPEGQLNIAQIFELLGHTQEKNIILQMDIEGAEWEFFETITEAQMGRFAQIIVEFHGLTNKDRLPYFTKIFEKISKTHQSVHFHYNNHGPILGFQDFLVSSLFEVSFIRRDMGTFTPSTACYPTPLDAPCVTRFPDVFIGNFAVLTGRDTTPPRHIPIALRDRYTLGGTIPVIDFYRDDRRPRPVHNTEEVYARVINAIQNGTFTYYGETLAYMQAAFEEFPLAGKTVLVHGLLGCNCDALSLVAGAERVVVVDYNPPRCDHPKVDVMTMAELEKSGLKADIAFSISSFEHDGLGRYGDPLNPEGDFRAMEEATRYLKTDGLLFLAVPVGQDCLAWNAHRIYGPRRLPLLLQKWTFLKAFGLKPEGFTANPLGKYNQPVMVLSNNPAAVHIPSSATPRQVREISELAAHGAFDRAHYMQSYPEVLACGMDVVSHYVLHGAAEGKNPAPWFDTRNYCEKNQEIAETGCNPFHHYLIARHTGK